MIDQSEFFAKYRIEDFEAAGLEWDELEAIHNHYCEKRPNLELAANYIASCLQQVEAVHSLKIRLKDPEHLIEKIIRKRKEDNSREINSENYTSEITDLIGIRALHLFKEDWAQIHNFITGKWESHEPPIAYHRNGDSEDFLEGFRERGCDVQPHKWGYRSVHYLVTSTPAKEQHIVEIQVRTIFEEGWSEIDHMIRYPYDMNDVVLNQYLRIFNGLAGSADEMGSFVKRLKREFRQWAREADKALQERNKLKRELKEAVGQLDIEKAEKERLEERIEQLSLLQAPSRVVVSPSHLSLSGGVEVYEGSPYADGSLSSSESLFSESWDTQLETRGGVLLTPTFQAEPAKLVNTCRNCGKHIDFDTITCPSCGTFQRSPI